MEVNEADWCRNEDVDGVDGVVCREFDDALVNDLWRREMTGVVCEWWRWARDGTWFGERGVEFCRSLSEFRNDGVKGAGDGDWLEVDVGEKVKTEGFVLRGMCKGGGLWRDFEVSSVCEHDDVLNEQSSKIEMILLLASIVMIAERRLTKWISCFYDEY